MSDVDLQKALQVALTAGRRAATMLHEGENASFSISHKSEMELVTSLDQASEDLLVKMLASAFPDHAIVSEEGSTVGRPDEGLQPIWFIDPLDGTTNYAHHLPWYAVSIGLEINKQPVVGVVLAPSLGWEFTAVRGGGAHQNGKALHVTNTAQITRALVGTGFPYDHRVSPHNNVAEVSAVIPHIQCLRRMGSAALDCCLVASGRLDAYWEFKLKPWDVCAGTLIVEEAGGLVTDVDGSPFQLRAGQILASNGRVHQELQRLLATAPKNRRRP